PPERYTLSLHDALPISEPLLAHTALRPAAAFLERIDEIGPRTLQRRIKTHRESRHERKPDRKKEHRHGERARVSLFDREKVCREDRKSTRLNSSHLVIS